MAFNLKDRIEVYMGPSAIGAPDDLEAAIVGFIDRAKVSLDAAVQEIESRAITEAFVRAKQRGVRVRIVLEQDYLRAGKPPPDPFDIGEAEDEENRALFAAMLRANIDARADYNPDIFHQKFIVRDSGKPRRALLTGSTNFTPTGVGRNLNHVVILHDQRVCNEYDLEFAEIWTGTFGRKRNRHEPSPRNNRVAGIRVRALFAPDHAPEMEIMKQILKARERIDFAIFTFSKSSGIDDALVAMSRGGVAQGGVAVRGIFDSGQGNRDWAATRLVANGGGEAFLASRKNGLGKLHHKLMVIDSSLIIAGSFNYTDPANRLNDENILLIGELGEDDPQAKADQEALAGFALAEIDRMIAAHGVAVPPDP